MLSLEAFLAGFLATGFSSDSSYSEEDWATGFLAIGFLTYFEPFLLAIGFYSSDSSSEEDAFLATTFFATTFFFSMIYSSDDSESDFLAIFFTCFTAFLDFGASIISSSEDSSDDSWSFASFLDFIIGLTLGTYFGLFTFLATGFYYDSYSEDSSTTFFAFLLPLSADNFLGGASTALAFFPNLGLTSESTDSALDPFRTGFFFVTLAGSGVSYSSDSTFATTLAFLAFGGVIFFLAPTLIFASSSKGLLSSSSEAYTIKTKILQ